MSMTSVDASKEEIIRIITKSRQAAFEEGIKEGAKRELEEILELLRDKATMGWELDTGLRSGDCESVAEWIEKKRN